MGLGLQRIDKQRESVSSRIKRNLGFFGYKMIHTKVKTRPEIH
jgi:hypothetical protein